MAQVEYREYRLALGKEFSKGLKYARTFSGVYQASTKTWWIPTTRNGVFNNALNAPRAYSLIATGQTMMVEPQAIKDAMGAN